MRVLLTTDTVGGVWTFTKELSEGLLTSGHEVALIGFGRFPSRPQKEWLDKLTASYGRCFSYTATELPLEWMQQNQAVFASGADVIEKVVLRFDPDILHSNQFCWGALEVNIPIAVTGHSDVLSWAAAVKPELLQGSPWLTRYRSLVQRGLRGASAVIAPSEWMLRQLELRYEVASRSRVIYNGRAVPLDEALCERKMQGVTVGRFWDEGKGLSALSETTLPLPFMLAGDNSFDGKSMPAPSHLTTLGSLGEADLFHLFRQSSIYVATSVYEPFGLAPLEAALCGCAVVARDLPSFREVWGDAAIYFRDAAQLGKVLRELSMNTELMRHFQRASSTRAQRFTARAMTSEYVALYSELIASSPAPNRVQELATHGL